MPHSTQRARYNQVPFMSNKFHKGIMNDSSANLRKIRLPKTNVLIE